MKEQLKLIGKKATIWAGGLKVNVKILDFKSSYGHDRYKVTPVSGEGEVWVEKVTV
jgi:hypothetical protein